MDIPRPDNFNETYLYEGACSRAASQPASQPRLTPTKLDNDPFADIYMRI